MKGFIDRSMRSGRFMDRLMSNGGNYEQISLAVEGFMERFMSSGGIYGQISLAVEGFMDRLIQQWRNLWID